MVQAAQILYFQPLHQLVVAVAVPVIVEMDYQAALAVVVQVGLVLVVALELLIKVLLAVDQMVDNHIEVLAVVVQALEVLPLNLVATEETVLQ
jgi:hypothetical protein